MTEAVCRSQKHVRGTLLIALLFVTSNGCASYMALKAPGQKDLSLLRPGASRSHVIAELGEPLDSQRMNYGHKDVYAFKQGYKTPTKVVRAVGHGTADFLTLFLWEIVGTPLEASMQGEDVRAEICYDESMTARRIEFFAGAHLVQGGPVFANWTRGKDTQQSLVLGELPPGASMANDTGTPQIPEGTQIEVASHLKADPF